MIMELHGRLALNAENAMGCVALTPEGDETTYIQERLRLVMDIYNHR